MEEASSGAAWSGDEPPIPTLRLTIGSCSFPVELMCLKTMMGDESASFECFLLVP
jgi:hypothetical protein